MSLLDLAQQKGIKPLGTQVAPPSAPKPNFTGPVNPATTHPLNPLNPHNTLETPGLPGIHGEQYSQPETSVAKNFWDNLGPNLLNSGNAVSDYVNNSMDKAIQGGAAQVKQGFDTAANAKNPGQLFQAVGQLGSGAAGVISSPFAGALKPVEQGVNAFADRISNNPGVQNFANSKAGEVTSQVAENIGNYANIAETVGSFMEAPAALKEFKGAVSGVVDRALVPKEVPLNAAKVTDLYNRAIRPTVAGKSNAAQIQGANTKVLSGLQTIAENKPNLKFTDANGEVVTGKAPQTVDQLSQAIQQTKQTVFKQYDALAKQAGGQGIKVDPLNIAKELQPVIDSQSLKIANPKAIDYATNLQQRLVEAGQLTPEITQEIIQHYNEVLKAFYRNPSAETATTAGIDAMVANKLRESLDSQISSATGEQYQALKNQYGALKSMEKDVAHRATVWGRQNQVGLASNLANLASGAELVKALVTLNPADLVVGGAIKGIQKYIQYLNNPDSGISKIFSHLEQSGRPSTGSTPLPSTPGEIKGNTSPNSSITPPESQVLENNPEAGFIKNPFANMFNKVHPEDIQVMKDFIDAVRVDKKPSQQLQLDASRIAEHYGLSSPKSLSGLANSFDEYLSKNKQKYGPSFKQFPK